MSLVDDYSRMMRVYMLKTKDEALSCFKKFKLLVENGTPQGIRVLRTDRGGEFCSKEFDSFCEEQGILRHYTAPYTPQQNGVVERRNRTVVAMARTFMKTPVVHTKKLDDRSQMMVHFGREPGMKAYRLFDLTRGKIYISRDVVFSEDKAWEWSFENQSGTSSTCHFICENDIVTKPNESEIREHEPDLPASPATPQTSVSTMSGSSSECDNLAHSSASTSSSEQPQRYKNFADIYANTSETVFENELLLMGIYEPICVEQAIKHPVWKASMDQEIDAIKRNQTWQLVDLLTGHKPIDLKWVFKKKTDQNGKVTKQKARLVAKGYVQRHGIDYDEVFAPVTRLKTVRLLLALAAKHAWEVHHLDVKSAFLNGLIQEEVYVCQPQGYVKQGFENKVYKLFKALYGLRQAPRAWYSRLSQYLLMLGFVKCPFEHVVYNKKDGDNSLIVGIHVDDLLVTGTSLSDITKFKEDMSREFDMSDLGKLSYYLGLEVTQGDGFIELRQSNYAKKVLEKAGLVDCNAVKFPMEYKLQLSADQTGEPINPTYFKSIVGGLRYLVQTRPNIAYAVGIVSRYMERPTEIHLNDIKRIYRYIKGTLQYGLIYAKDRGNYILSRFSDSDLAGSLDDRKSTGEFMAATAAAFQVIWLQRVLSHITGSKTGPVTVYIDNRSVVDLAQNPVFHVRSKHIDLRYHFIRDCLDKGLIVIKYVRTSE
ncbi:hypothetical protein AgCh_000328 [Apium graveolens]